MTLQEAKDQAAMEAGWANWNAAASNKFKVAPDIPMDEISEQENV